MMKNDVNLSKPWQHGFDLDMLKAIEKEYNHYNSFTASPFAAYKKNNIAEDLHTGALITQRNQDGSVAARMALHRVKVGSAIKMFPNVTIAYKAPKDVVLTSIIGKPNLEHLRGENVWAYTWAEDSLMAMEMQWNDFRYIGGKITTFGEIYSIWFRKGVHPFFNDCEFSIGLPEIDPVNLVNIKHVTYTRENVIKQIATILNGLQLDFSNHYSNYNSKNAWSALSLRGYSADPLFIAKPIEMSNKWKLDHKNETYFLQDTKIYNHFPMVYEMISSLFPNTEIHRVRFMKLNPGGGELQRHTDQVDPDAGNNLEQIARFHFPIVTNPDVHFVSWNSLGEPRDVYMRVGECWVLDTRFPHKVVNAGDTERIHLVVDVKVTQKIKDMILS